MGKVVMITGDSKETEITLHDISQEGAGFDLPVGNPKGIKISVGSQVRFKCTWNPNLFGSHFYEVRSILGHRVGVKRL